MHKTTKQQRIQRRPHRLVQHRLGGRVALAQARVGLDEAALARLGVELLFVAGGGGGEGGLGRREVHGRGEGGFEEVLPEEVGRGGDEAEEEELEDGGPGEGEGGLGGVLDLVWGGEGGGTCVGLLGGDDLGDDVGEGVEEGGLEGCFDDGGEGHGGGYEGEMAPESPTRDVNFVGIIAGRSEKLKSWTVSGVDGVDE